GRRRGHPGNGTSRQGTGTRRGAPRGEDPGMTDAGMRDEMTMSHVTSAPAPGPRRGPGRPAPATPTTMSAMSASPVPTREPSVLPVPRDGIAGAAPYGAPQLPVAHALNVN